MTVNHLRYVGNQIWIFCKINRNSVRQNWYCVAVILEGHEFRSSSATKAPRRCLRLSPRASKRRKEMRSETAVREASPSKEVDRQMAQGSLLLPAEGLASRKRPSRGTSEAVWSC
ncbi:rCG51768 [Rattus norvegicus]|uniref:RCG51768 n=1 Tax=Rattus norvegicus TaxID=10116 RepID=A6K344_RAT|nr:rCG51768 [Rattus norvegicus]